MRLGEERESVEPERTCHLVAFTVHLSRALWICVRLRRERKKRSVELKHMIVWQKTSAYCAAFWARRASLSSAMESWSGRRDRRVKGRSKGAQAGWERRTLVPLPLGRETAALDPSPMTKTLERRVAKVRPMTS